MRAHRRRTRSGFTLLEMAVALVLFALVMGNVYTIVGGTTKAIVDRNSEHQADAQSLRALDRIAMAIVGSYAGSLHSTSVTPGSEPEINYKEFLGINSANERVESEPMRIAFTSDSGGSITWFQNPELETQKRVVWTKDVPAVALGEVAENGIDDNGNGIIDEAGLAFVKDGRSVRILLTLRRPDGEGGFVDKQLETVVTCRN